MGTYPYQPAPKSRMSRGFSLLEVVIAITVLTIGMVGLATLIAQSLTGTERARYVSLSTTLTSEKLEDLNRWPAVDPHVAAGGSLTSDNASGSVNYYDDVDLSNTTGQVSETMASTTGGVTTYTTVIHKATGEVIPAQNSTAPTGSGIVAFHRRWLIEADPVVNGVTLTGARRVTVLVTPTNQTINGGVSFQMSAIRP
jgi:prepilin-type N-terminal cleavage/methylation domain-containing protein